MRNQGQRISDAMNALIYRRYKRDGLSKRDVGRLFGVSETHVGKVIREMESVRTMNVGAPLVGDQDRATTRVAPTSNDDEREVA